jgi:hypothetical protein
MNDEWVKLDDDKIRADYAKLVEKYPQLKGTENDMPILGEKTSRPFNG